MFWQKSNIFTTSKGKERIKTMAILTTDQKQVINKCVDKIILSENKEEMLNYFLRCFCFNTENCNLLLRAIPQIAEQMNNINQAKISEHSLALDLAIGSVAREKYKPTKDNRQRFAMLAILLKVQYPSGKFDTASLNVKSLFEEMISYIKDKTGFDMNKKEDWNWAFDIAHTGDFLVNVIRNNIDENFECPYIG